MTNEHLAAMIQSDPEEYKELLPVLWDKVKRLLYAKARDFYKRHSDSCTRRGVELSDIDSTMYEVFLDAVKAYKPDSEPPFTSYLNYPFKLKVQELLDIRTERGRREPLNNCNSLDRAVDEEDQDSATLGDLIADPASCFEDDLLEELNAEREAQIVRSAVELLPVRLRIVIKAYYFEGQTLAQIAEQLHVSQEMVRQIKRQALLKLRRDKRLQLIHADRIANARVAQADKGAVTGQKSFADLVLEEVQRLSRTA